MVDMAQAAKKVHDLLQGVFREGGFDLTCSVQNPNGTQVIIVTIGGSDTGFLTERNGELLHALKLIATQAAGFDAEEWRRINFDLESLGITRQLDVYASIPEPPKSSRSLWQDLVLCSVKDEPADW